MNVVSTFVKGDGTTTEPGRETLEKLVKAHFPAARADIPHKIYSAENAVTFERVEGAFTEWVDTDSVRTAL